jgi:hypothetical protein
MLGKGKSPDEIHELLDYPMEDIYLVSSNLHNGISVEE